MGKLFFKTQNKAIIMIKKIKGENIYMRTVEVSRNLKSAICELFY